MSSFSVENDSLKQIEERLEELVHKWEGPHASLSESARYTLFAPSKRLRPLFVLAILRDYQVPIKYGIDSALALELIHTYSIIHDDLPCMDDDHLRRGKPSLHVIYGEAHAILTGDYLLTRAFEVLAKAAHLDSTTKLSLIELLAKRSGSHGMIGGQVIDLSFEGKPIDKETLEQMHLWKTASLFSTAFEFGAKIVKAEEEDQQKLIECGTAFGMGYQIGDDILDIIADLNTLGKPLQSDLAKKKATFPSYYGLEKSQKLFYHFFTVALDKLSSLSFPMPHVQKFLHLQYSRFTEIFTS